MTANPMIRCGRGICAAEEGHEGTCDEASGWAETECGPDCPQDCGCRVDAGPERAESGVGAHPGAELSPSGYPSDPPALNGPQNRAERVSDAEAAEWARLAGEATEGPWVVDQDGSIGAPMAGLVCGEDGHPRPDCSECGTRVCHTSVMPGEPDAAFIAAARTAVPRLLADRERLTAENARMRQVAELRVGTWRDTAARLEGERDRARGTAATLEAENARLTEALYLTRITLEATFRVLQEASGLPDDIDDPDCRDEMVLALRPRAEKAEAENARLREGIERLCSDIDNPLRERHDESPHDLPEVAEDLRALLADTDSAQDEGGE